MMIEQKEVTAETELLDRALSIRQPWAWLIVHGHKDIENRPRRTNHRGRILVHASLTFDTAGYHYVRRHFPHIDMPLPEDFEMGGIVGAVYITDCVSDSPSRWFFGPFGYILEDAKPLPFKPCKGQLGLFRVGY